VIGATRILYGVPPCGWRLSVGKALTEKGIGEGAHDPVTADHAAVQHGLSRRSTSR